MVGVDVGINDVGNADVCLRCLIHEPIFVARDHIDGGRNGVPRAAKK